MLAKRIIPCLDIDNGRVVKGTQFVNLQDAGNPVEVAKRYNYEGADELIFLDITASSSNKETTLDLVNQVASEVFIPLTVGGGIRSPNDIYQALRAGADKVSLNTAAINNPQLIAESANYFGSQCIVVAIDAKKISNTEWRIFTHGGRKQTTLDPIEWAKLVEDKGAGEILLTSMDNDGSKNGFDLELTRKVSEAVNIPVIASGGVGNLQHLADGFLTGKADAVLAASIFHFGKYSIREAKHFLQQRNIPVRYDN